MSTLTGQQIAGSGLTGWVFLGDALYTRAATGSFAAGLALVDAIGAAAEAANHHPDVDLRYPHVDIRLTSHDAGGVTDRDVAMARTVTDLARDAGASLDGAGLSRLELALDTPERDGIRPFWREFLAYDGGAEGERPWAADEIGDPLGRLPVLWFQASGAEEPRQRWHLDVWVDPSEVRGRIARAVAAGGRVVDDSRAPAFWVLADAEGNRSCLCTWQARDGENE
ncbi:4a-hydroxytetrahydrobiopterin dehydratase [Myceligenerans xiligouense]|uniref:Putative pterin-4-alpha-carbinolamine dehydratase n=1 Tax=Myceligenerans xiligouense TaxID=253184 RepID=A0A3N4YMN9_9MICO|nr:4a-hydroxytetrahydrobiopterin dehydratase [Myceligenerans xiligouense]RPF21377.1 4a-hydroxytetrahydrobiopterin dehydratase [Myceligenerans xiligouense]